MLIPSYHVTVNDLPITGARSVTLQVASEAAAMLRAERVKGKKFSYAPCGAECQHTGALVSAA